MGVEDHFSNPGDRKGSGGAKEYEVKTIFLLGVFLNFMLILIWAMLQEYGGLFVAVVSGALCMVGAAYSR